MLESIESCSFVKQLTKCCRTIHSLHRLSQRSGYVPARQDEETHTFDLRDGVFGIAQISLHDLRDRHTLLGEEPTEQTRQTPWKKA